MWHHGWLTVIYDQLYVCSNQRKKITFHSRTIHHKSISPTHIMCIHYFYTTLYVRRYQWHAKSGNSVQWTNEWMNEWETKRICTVHGQQQSESEKQIKRRIREKERRKNTIQQWQYRLIEWEKERKMRKTKMWCPKKKKKRGKISKKEIRTHTHFFSFPISHLNERERERCFLKSGKCPWQLMQKSSFCNICSLLIFGTI